MTSPGPLILLSILVAGCGGIDDRGDASTDANKDPCVLQTSSYATSCNADTDCIHIWVGDGCNSDCFCPNAAINASSKSKYDADFAATTHGGGVCTCPAFPAPSCCTGTCVLGGCK